MCSLKHRDLGGFFGILTHIYSTVQNPYTCPFPKRWIRSVGILFHTEFFFSAWFCTIAPKKLHETHQGLDHWNSHLINLQLEVNLHPIHKFQSFPAWIFVVFMELVQILDQLPGLEGFGLAEKKVGTCLWGRLRLRLLILFNVLVLKGYVCIYIYICLVTKLWLYVFFFWNSYIT